MVRSGTEAPLENMNPRVETPRSNARGAMPCVFEVGSASDRLPQDSATSPKSPLNIRKQPASCGGFGKFATSSGDLQPACRLTLREAKVDETD